MSGLGEGGRACVESERWRCEFIAARHVGPKVVGDNGPPTLVDGLAWP